MKEGRTRKPQQWAQRPCHPFWECWALLQHPSPAGPKGRDQATWPEGRRAAGGGRRRASPRPSRWAPGRLPWQRGLAGVAKTHKRRVSPAPTPPPALTWPLDRPRRIRGPWTHTPPSLLPRAPARLLACSAQGDTIHVRAPKPGSGSPRSWLGPAPGGREPEPAPSGRGALVPGRPRLLIALATKRWARHRGPGHLDFPLKWHLTHLPFPIFLRLKIERNSKEPPTCKPWLMDELKPIDVWFIHGEPVLRDLSKYFTNLISFLLHTAPWRVHSSYPHFTDEETEAWTR